MAQCPCGSGRDLDACCGLYISGKEKAPTAEALMRSRYTAFATDHVDYLIETSTPHALKDFNVEQARHDAKQVQWQGLDILETQAGGANDNEGFVTFVFHYRFQNKNQSQHEKARFCKVGDAWLYDDSVLDPKGEPVRIEKTGRNDPCPCGSGKKYKKCCGA